MDNKPCDLDISTQNLDPVKFIDNRSSPLWTITEACSGWKWQEECSFTITLHCLLISLSVSLSRLSDFANTDQSVRTNILPRLVLFSPFVRQRERAGWRLWRTYRQAWVMLLMMRSELRHFCWIKRLTVYFSSSVSFKKQWAHWLGYCRKTLVRPINRPPCVYLKRKNAKDSAKRPGMKDRKREKRQRQSERGGSKSAFECV